jgi:hypothetical protein
MTLIGRDVVYPPSFYHDIPSPWALIKSVNRRICWSIHHRKEHYCSLPRCLVHPQERTQMRAARNPRPRVREHRRLPTANYFQTLHLAKTHHSMWVYFHVTHCCMLTRTDIQDSTTVVRQPSPISPTRNKNKGKNKVRPLSFNLTHINFYFKDQEKGEETSQDLNF